MIPRKCRNTRLALQRLERRDAPANFNIANGDTAAFIAAVNTCNINNEADTINLAVNGTYTFASAADMAEGGSALPTILRDAADTNTVTIFGHGSTIQRSSVAGTPNFRLLRIGNFPDIVGVTLDSITFTNGNAGSAATNYGGAVELSAGDLTVTNCTFAQNQSGYGGAIYATNTISPPRTLSITNSSFSGNQATNGQGGAVYMLGATNVSITGGSYLNNTSTSDGGALRVQTSSANTTIAGALFANNMVTGSGGGGGAILIQGNATITDTTIRDNTCVSTGSGSGGGLWVQTSLTGTLMMSGCTLSGNRENNSTGSGGGLFSQVGIVTIVNCTIHNNRGGSGGGIAFVNGTATASVTNSTITNNSAFFGLASGGGVELTGAGTLSIGNTIVAGNMLESGGSGPDIGGTVNSTGYNLIQNTTGATINGTTTGNIYNTDPNLGPLQMNGGLTPTRLPNAGSLVINAGDPAFVPPPATDQRGAGFPRIVNGRLDIGAVEFSATAPRITNTQVNDGTAQRSRVTSLTVTFSTQVTFASTAGAAFTLTRISDAAAVSFTATATVMGGVTVVTLNSFTGSATQFGSLADGRYTLTALASQITANGQALDGNGDGTPGDNYSFGDAQGLFRFFGDINGDRHVDIADFGMFSSTFNLSTGQTGFNAAFDFNGDGHVDIADFGQFALRFFTVLP